MIRGDNFRLLPGDPLAMDVARMWPFADTWSRSPTPEPAPVPRVLSPPAPAAAFRSGYFKPWERSLIAEHWPKGTSCAWIAEQMNRAPSAVQRKATTMGLHRGRKRP